jgi:ABC-type transport system involved in multi-copper enzyme maturation permease subunit
MTPVLLLARSFIRQNRWLLVAFVLWPFLLGAFTWSPKHRANEVEIREIVQQEVFYGVAVVAFLASSAVYNEKRSRRIIGLLSKGISRGQYLCGLLLACSAFAAIYFAAVAGSVIWLIGTSGPSLLACICLLAQGFSAAFWAAALSLLFATFLHPFLAAAIAGSAAFAPLTMSKPNATIGSAAMLMNSAGGLAPNIVWSAIFAASWEGVAFTFIAISIFATRDVTVSIE